jgi:hypothetical protein
MNPLRARTRATVHQRLPVLLALVLAACGDPKVESKRLPSPNPTTYTFDAGIVEIHQAIRQLYEQQFRERSRYLFTPAFPGEDNLTDEMAALFSQPGNENDAYFSYMHDPVGMSQVYSVAGEPVPYLADFHLHIASQGPGKTRIEVRTLRPEVLAGRTLLPRHHMTRANIYLPVEPTTIEEYSILLKIGAIIGQTDMPPLFVPKE